MKMDESLRMDIAQNYGSECWDPITGKLWNGSEGFQLFKFEQDVVHTASTWRCIIVRKDVFDAEISAEDIDHSEDIFAEAWRL